MTIPRWIHQIILYPLAILSISINTLLITLVSHQSSRNLGKYRVLLCIFASVDMVISIVHASILPAFVQVEFGFVVFAHDTLYLPESLGSFFNTLYCVLYYEPFVLLAFHFLYRIISVLKLNMIERNFTVFVASLAIVNTGVVTLISVECWILHNQEDEHFFADVMMSQYGIDLNQVPKHNILEVHYVHAPDHGSGLNWIAIVTMFNCGLLASTTIVFSATCGALTMRAVNTRMMSDASRILQVQLLRALIIQFTIPVMFTILPFFCIVALPASGLNFGQTGTVVAFFASAFPVLDPICMIVVYPRFRLLVVDFVARRNGTVKPTVDAMTTAVSQTTPVVLELSSFRE